MKDKTKKKPRGGTRPFSGRKKADYETKTIAFRVRGGFVEPIKKMEEFIEMKKLADRIYQFIDKYAGVRPDWDAQYDDEDDKFTSPDASQMKYCADMISKGLKPQQCWSEWSSGGYKTYSSKEGREEHDYLVKEIYKIINS